MNIKTVIL